MKIIKYFKYMSKHSQSYRELRDLILFDNILKRSHIVLIRNREKTHYVFYNYKSIEHYSVSKRNHHFLSQLISKKHAKTLQDIFKRNNTNFINNYEKWKFNSIKEKDTGWEISNYNYDITGTQVTIFTYKKINLIYDLSFHRAYKQQNHKSSLFPLEPIDEKDTIKTSKILFENKFKENEVFENLIIFYQQIAYSEKQNAKDFVLQ